MPRSRKAHTFSLEWNSRDFLLARTWMWLDTCGVRERRKTKEQPVTMAMKSPLQLGIARPTLMAAWISRTFFLAKTCMWLDTSINKIKKGKGKTQENNKSTKWKTHILVTKAGDASHNGRISEAHSERIKPIKHCAVCCCHLSEVIKEDAGPFSAH